MQGGDFSYSHYYNQNPNPNDLLLPSNPQTIASAPPFSQHFSSSDPFSSPYPQLSQNSDPTPPSTYSQPPFPPPDVTSASLQQPLSVPYYSYDQHPTAVSYPHNPNPDPAVLGPYHSYGLPPPTYGTPSENRYGYDARPDFEQESVRQHYQNGPSVDGLEAEVYAYDGGSVEPYGAWGTGKSSSSSRSGFDDYGRVTSFGEDAVEPSKIVRAVPKVETQQDAKSGVQKFRVKLLPEGAGQTTMDVLCQIGLDGIRMLDPNTNRTIRIYPLETVTRWEVNEPSTYTFWAKSPVDIEPRRIRLQSNRYTDTTNTILDTVTAATIQLKEMGGKDSVARSKGSYDDAGKLSVEPMEKKKGFGDWMNLIKPGNEEKHHWVPDEAVTKCKACGTDFGAFVRKHHCRNCGDIFCDKCTQGRIALTADEQSQPVRVCDGCLAEVSQRLSNAKEKIGKSAVQHSHEDLARKLQEEMERNHKSSSSGAKSSSGSGKQMREVACPICTVHLQVHVPDSGSETIECGVCQHPFLVSAH
ncbi:protein FREE1-like [Magnolia sinica]|uniref:protein FREE1-like n=1 Tax=Magnolia sinica TaxID=86752 RepID=UPI00265837C0|nr:protein FREE1-like [Magnolia sinica]